MKKLSIALILMAAGCSDVSYEYGDNAACTLNSDCYYPCEYCVGGVCVASPGSTENKNCAWRPKSCSQASDCNYPCGFCFKGMCLENPNRADIDDCK